MGSVSKKIEAERAEAAAHLGSSATLPKFVQIATTDARETVDTPHGELITTDSPTPTLTDLRLHREAPTEKEVKALALPSEDPTLERADPRKIADILGNELNKHISVKYGGFVFHVDGDIDKLAATTNGHTPTVLHEAEKRYNYQHKANGQRDMYRQAAHSLSGQELEDWLHDMSGFDEQRLAAKASEALDSGDNDRFNRTLVDLTRGQKAKISDAYADQHHEDPNALLRDTQKENSGVIESIRRFWRKHFGGTGESERSIAAVTGKEDYVLVQRISAAFAGKDRQAIADYICSQPRETMARVQSEFDELGKKDGKTFSAELGKLFTGPERAYLELRLSKIPSLDDLVDIAAQVVQSGHSSNLLATELAQSLRPEQVSLFEKKLADKTATSGKINQLVPAKASAQSNDLITDLAHRGDAAYFAKLVDQPNIDYRRLSTLLAALSPDQLQGLSLYHYRDTHRDLFFDLADIAHRGGYEKSPSGQPIEVELATAFFGKFAHLALEMRAAIDDGHEGELWRLITYKYYPLSDRDAQLTAQAWECMYGKRGDLFVGEDQRDALKNERREGMLRDHLLAKVPDSYYVSTHIHPEQTGDRITAARKVLTRAPWESEPVEELVMDVLGHFPAVPQYSKSQREAGLRQGVFSAMVRK